MPVFFLYSAKAISSIDLKFEARFEPDDEAAVWPGEGPEAADMVMESEDIWGR